jgi:hypothetical protein
VAFHVLRLTYVFVTHVVTETETGVRKIWLVKTGNRKTFRNISPPSFHRGIATTSLRLAIAQEVIPSCIQFHFISTKHHPSAPSSSFKRSIAQLPELVATHLWTLPTVAMAQYILDLVYTLTNCMSCFPGSPQLKINSRSFKILRLLGEVRKVPTSCPCKS